MSSRSATRWLPIVWSRLWALGVGKTRLALALLQRVHEQFRDGARFVDLSPLRDPELAMPTIAQMLGIGETGEHSVQQVLIDGLRARNLLLVLEGTPQFHQRVPGYVVMAPGSSHTPIVEGGTMAVVTLRRQSRRPVF